MDKLIKQQRKEKLVVTIDKDIHNLLTETGKEYESTISYITNCVLKAWKQHEEEKLNKQPKTKNGSKTSKRT